MLLLVLLLIYVHTVSCRSACKGPLSLPLPLLLLLQGRRMISVVIAAVVAISCKRLDPATCGNFLQEPTWRQRFCEEGLWWAELTRAVAVMQLTQQQAAELT
jgi:hypothetical protein